MWLLTILILVPEACFQCFQQFLCLSCGWDVVCSKVVLVLSIVSDFCSIEIFNPSKRKPIKHFQPIRLTNVAKDGHIYLLHCVSVSHTGLPLEQGWTGAEPSQQTRSDLGHPPLPPPPLPPLGVLPSAQVIGFSPSGQVGLLPSSHFFFLPSPLVGVLPSAQVIGFSPSGQVGLLPSSHFGFFARDMLIEQVMVQTIRIVETFMVDYGVVGDSQDTQLYTDIRYASLNTQLDH